jgi:hypothetical protein
MIKGKQKTKQGNLKHNIFISHFIRAIFWNDQDWKSLKKNAQICLSVFTINYINKRTPFTRVVWPSRSLHEGLYGSSDGCCYVDRCHLTRVVWPSRILHEGLYGSSDGCCYVDRCHLTRVVWPSRILHEGLYGSSDGCCYVDRCYLTRVVRLYGSSDGCCYVDRYHLPSDESPTTTTNCIPCALMSALSDG